MTQPGAEPGASSELVPLAERTNILQVFRLTMIAAVLLGAALWPETVGAPQRALAPVTAVYALLTAAVEVVRRSLHRRCLTLVGALLLADGLWIAAVVARTGGPRSLLTVLVGLHVVAVTLLASYRTGLKIAVWHSLLFILAHTLREAGITDRWDPPAFAGAGDVPVSMVGAGVVTFLVLAVGTAAFSSLNERELRRSRRGLQGLVAMGTELQDLRSPEDVGPVVLRSVLRTFGAPRGAFVLGDHSGVRQVWVGRAGEAPPGPLPSQERMPGELLCRCWTSRQPQLVRILGTDDRILDEALPGARNLVVVPMISDASVIGALVVEHGGGLSEVMSASRINALLEFAAHGALSIRSVTLVAEVARLARVDDLTGLPNRRTFDETLDREVVRAARSNEPLSLVMLDVDHFKRINDSLGHAGGDEVLRRIGRILATSLRQIDLPARFGGDEFALVLPDCTPEAALRLTEHLTQEIASAHGNRPELSVTMSAGISSFPRNALTGAELMRHADEALYQSKRDGRNRVTFAKRRAPVAAATGADRLVVPA
ncbi:MAG TPA: sensor domain-containing diguanylate cyclase [Acidimicrobiales bacterium]|nr:sensor domain-containing diguanylate cyclase [Acidimicrobiales bacterium]